MAGQFISGTRRQGVHNQRPFGVYRPLTPDCAVAVDEAMYWAVEEASDYLRRRGKKRESFNMLEHKGVTFAARKDVNRSLQYDALPIPLDETKAAELFADIVPIVPDTEVPISRVKWYRPLNRRIGADLLRGDALDDLGRVAEYVGVWLGELVKIGGPEPTVLRRPSHVTFGMYGTPEGREPLSDVQKTEVAAIFKDHLDLEGITHLTLGSWVVGEDYTRSYPEYAGINSPLMRAA